MLKKYLQISWLKLVTMSSTVVVFKVVADLLADNNFVWVGLPLIVAAILTFVWLLVSIFYSLAKFLFRVNINDKGWLLLLKTLLNVLLVSIGFSYVLEIVNIILLVIMGVDSPHRIQRFVLFVIEILFVVLYSRFIYRIYKKNIVKDSHKRLITIVALVFGALLFLALEVVSSK